MGQEHEYGYKLRLLRIMLAILERPFGYTKKQLMERYGVKDSAIKDDFKTFREAGFVLKSDKNHRYGFIVNQPYKQLKELLHFSEEDQILLHRAIDQVGQHSRRAERLKKKLASLYDYHRLGHAYLRKPYLKKVDLLEQAKKTKQLVVLKDYRSSNSNDMRDRYVEGFHISPSEDLLHAFDIKVTEKNQLRHFRISRMKSVQLLDSNWQNEGKHHIERSDAFRIVDDDQVSVHLRFKVGAYNELIERFPLSEPYIEYDETEDVYDFQCRVNREFKGITNFILGFHHQMVDILEPDSLIDHLQIEAKKIQEKLGVGR